MHKKNTLNAEVLWFVTSRLSGLQSVTAHGSKVAAERAKENLIAYQGIARSEIHIYAGQKVGE